MVFICNFIVNWLNSSEKARQNTKAEDFSIESEQQFMLLMMPEWLLVCLVCIGITWRIEHTVIIPEAANSQHKLTNMTLQVTLKFQRQCKIIFSRNLDMSFHCQLTWPSHLTLITLLFMLFRNPIIQPTHSNQTWKLPKIKSDWYIKTLPYFQFSD